MKPRKQIILITLLGLLLFAFAAVIAQTPAQGDQKKPAESCCAMESCCCSDGSCPMKKEGETNPGGDAAAAKNCCGESCDMSKHDAKHDKNNHKDCCKMKQKDKNKKVA